MAADLTILPNVSLAEQTTFRIGGLARCLTRVYAEEQITAAVAWARDQKLPVLVLGEGSNVLLAESGFPGLVIQNRISGFHRDGNEVEVGGGENLGRVIEKLNVLRLSGIECMYGIPGSVAGAIVGNAGAYGQEIGSVTVTVSYWSDGSIHTVDSSRADFRYRHSTFKCNRQFVVVRCRLRLQPVDAPLQPISDEILARRLTKYPAGLRCPGSFFKNVLASQLTPDQLKQVPSEFIQFGKIPAGRLLEAVGAKGAQRGDAIIAPYHGNLFINRGRATSKDIIDLAEEYAEKVWKRFGIRLEPEILIVDADERLSFDFRTPAAG